MSVNSGRRVKASTAAVAAASARAERSQLPDGRWLEAGQLVKVNGERGTFKVMWFDADGNVTAHGGTTGRERTRTFRPDRIGARKRPPK